MHARTPPTHPDACPGDERIKDKGLNCTYIIARRPENQATSERAIPVSIFSAEPPVSRAWLRKWCGDLGSGEQTAAERSRACDCRGRMRLSLSLGRCLHALGAPTFELPPLSNAHVLAPTPNATSPSRAQPRLTRSRTCVTSWTGTTTGSASATRFKRSSPSRRPCRACQTRCRASSTQTGSARRCEHGGGRMLPMGARAGCTAARAVLLHACMQHQRDSCE